MADIKPSIDLKKVNLQTAVGYLVSLHENEYEWNLLGIKVVGNVDTVDQLPDSAAEYGDTYAVGTEEPYIFYVWTRADGGVHASDYWFPLGKFPMPGPQGPKGDGLETVTDMSTGKPTATSKVDGGIKADYSVTVTIVNPDTGAKTTLTIPISIVSPLKAGTDIELKADGTVGVDETALELKFLKKNTTEDSVVPVLHKGTVEWASATNAARGNSIVRRTDNGAIGVVYLYTDEIVDKATGDYRSTPKQIFACTDKDANVVKLTNATTQGTLSASQYSQLRDYPTARIERGKLSYIRFTPPYYAVNIKYWRYVAIDEYGTIHLIMVSANPDNRTWTYSTLSSTNTYLHKIMLTTVSGDSWFEFTLQSSRATAYADTDTTALGTAMAKTKPLMGIYTYTTTATEQLAYLVQDTGVTNWKLYMYNGDLQLSSLNLDTCIIGDTVSEM